MEFSDDGEEEEKPSAELVANLRQKITSLEEEVAELHIGVLDQNDNIVVLRKAITNKVKRFVVALSDPKLYNVPSP